MNHGYLVYSTYTYTTLQPRSSEVTRNTLRNHDLYITYTTVIANHRNLSIVRCSVICDIWTWWKWHHFGKHFQAKGSSDAHSPYYIVYIILPIASIYDLGSIFTSGRIHQIWTSLPYYIIILQMHMYRYTHRENTHWVTWAQATTHTYPASSHQPACWCYGVSCSAPFWPVQSQWNETWFWLKSVCTVCLCALNAALTEEMNVLTS